MSPEVLRFSGSVLELLAWIGCLLLIVASAFWWGWLVRDIKALNERGGDDE